MKIYINKIQCMKCKDIESKNVHDIKLCKYGAVGLNGGTYYFRTIGKKEDIIEMSKFEQ